MITHAVVVHSVLQVKTSHEFTDVKFTNESSVVGCTVTFVAIHTINADTIVLAWLRYTFIYVL